MWYVYIIHSLLDNGFYIGCTSDLNKRIIKHNSGGNISTRHRKPFEIVHVEEYDSKSIAFARERLIKSYKGGESFKKLINK